MAEHKPLNIEGNICSTSRCFLVWAILVTIIAFGLMIGLIVNKNASPAIKTERIIRWCVINDDEMKKCKQFADSVATMTTLDVEIKCSQESDSDACVEGIIAGRHHTLAVDGGILVNYMDKLKPIVAEDYGSGPASYYAVAVAKASDDSTRFTKDGLKSKKSCHTGFEKTAGWNFPIGQMFQKGILESVGKCDPLATANNFFSKMCVPGSTACDLCKGTCKRNCDGEDYCGYSGAFRCVAEAGDVAFVKHTTVMENTDENNDEEWSKNLKSTDFVLLCPDGTRAPVTAYSECNLGKAPSHSVVVSKSASTKLVLRIQQLLQVSQLMFGPDLDDDGDFELFGGPGKDLLFKSSTKKLLPLTPDCDSKIFLGASYMNAVQFAKNCNGTAETTQTTNNCVLPQYQEIKVTNIRWCVKSNEKEKCEKMKNAINSLNLNDVHFTCVQGQDECGKLISEGSADLVTLDGGEIFKLARQFNLKPLAAEIYDRNKGEVGKTYFAVAVSKKSGSITFDNLKGLKTCHTGYAKTAGWMMPVGNLVEKNSLTVDSNCDIIKSMADFVNGSCVPNILSIRNDADTQKLCKSCKDDCSSSDEFANYDGALKCMVEGYGDVAFVKDATLKGLDPAKYQLLCLDGSVENIANYKDCNLAEVPTHAVVTSSSHTAEYRLKVWEVLNQLQKSNSFKMFESESDKNLIFSDSTQCLAKIDPECIWQNFLGEKYLEAVEALYCIKNPPNYKKAKCEISNC